MTDHSRLRRPGIAAATVAMVVAGIVGGVSAAGARENTTLFSVEGAAPCFSETKKTTCATGESPQLVMQTGETLTWDFSSGALPVGQWHNAQRKAGSATSDDNWNTFQPMIQQGGTQSFTFTKPGVYEFLCGVHQTMTGTVTVEGGAVTTTPTPSVTEVPTEVPTEEPTAVPTFSATPAATPTPDDHLNTPAPGRGAPKDTEAPRLLRAKVKTDRAGAKLSFWVSEPSTIQVYAYRKGVKKPVTSATLHVAAGTRSVVVRSSSLRKKGTYTFQWQATDAMANKGNIAKKTLRVKR